MFNKLTYLWKYLSYSFRVIIRALDSSFTTRNSWKGHLDILSLTTLSFINGSLILPIAPIFWTVWKYAFPFIYMKYANNTNVIKIRLRWKEKNKQGLWLKHKLNHFGAADIVSRTSTIVVWLVNLLSVSFPQLWH